MEFSPLSFKVKLYNMADNKVVKLSCQPKTTQFKIEKIIDCFGPVLTVEHIFGIFRFCISNNNLMPTTGLRKLFGLLITTVTVLVFALTYDVPRALSGILKVVDAMEDIPSVVFLFQYVTFALMTSCLLSKANVRIMTSLADLDVTLHINEKQELYKESKKHTIVALAIIFIIHLISSACDFLLDTTNDDGIVSKTLNYVLNFVQDLEILLFCLMIYTLKCRLTLINDNLVQLIRNNDDQDQLSVFIISQKNARTLKKSIRGGNVPASSLRDLSSAYDIIGDTCQLVNIVFNFQIFMTLISAFIYIVIALWASLYSFRAEIYAGNLVTIMLWCCSEMLTVASMAYVCETLLSTRNYTKVLVNELVMDYGLPANVRVQAKAFMELIDAWPLRIFVYDMFSVDITLMLKFISVSTTYLIVIIQVSHFA